MKVCLKSKDGDVETQLDNIPSCKLARCRYFQACMSEPWAPHQQQMQFDLQTPTSDHQSYERFFRLLDLTSVSPSTFPNIGDALRVLRVASHLLCDDWINASLQYLAGMPWTPSEGEVIRVALGSLELPLCEDLRARLKSDKSSSVQALKQVLEKVLAVNLRDGRNYPDYALGGAALWRNILKGSCPHLADMTRQLLYREWHKLCNEPESDRSSYKRRLWLSRMLVDVEEDAELIQTLSANTSYNFQDEGGLRLLEDILHRVANGAVILSNTHRLGILKVAITASFRGINDPLKAIHTHINTILGSLPVVDQAEFFSLWVDTPSQNLVYLTKALENYCAEIRSLS